MSLSRANNSFTSIAEWSINNQPLERVIKGNELQNSTTITHLLPDQSIVCSSDLYTKHCIQAIADTFKIMCEVANSQRERG